MWCWALGKDWSSRDQLVFRPAAKDRVSAVFADCVMQVWRRVELVRANLPDDKLCVHPIRTTKHAQAERTGDQVGLRLRLPQCAPKARDKIRMHGEALSGR